MNMVLNLIYQKYPINKELINVKQTEVPITAK